MGAVSDRTYPVYDLYECLRYEGLFDYVEDLDKDPGIIVSKLEAYIKNLKEEK